MIRPITAEFIFNQKVCFFFREIQFFGYILARLFHGKLLITAFNLCQIYIPLEISRNKISVRNANKKLLFPMNFE